MPVIIFTLITIVIGVIVFYSVRKHKRDIEIEKLSDQTEILKNKGDLQGALKALNSALNIKPNDVSLLNNKAVLLHEMGSDYYDEALKLYNKITEIDPNNAVIWYNKAALLAFMSAKDNSKHDEIIQAFDNAIKADPHYFTAYEFKAKTLNAFGCYEEALACYDTILNTFKFEDGIQSIYDGKAEAYIGLNKIDEAFKMYDMALEVDQNEELWTLSKGIALLNLPEVDNKKARTYFEKVLQLNTENVSALYDMGLTYYNEDDYENSKTYYDKAININPKDADVLNGLGLLYMNMPQPDYNTAIEYFNKALFAEPDHLFATENKRLALDFQIGKIE